MREEEERSSRDMMRKGRKKLWGNKGEARKKLGGNVRASGGGRYL